MIDPSARPLSFPPTSRQGRRTGVPALPQLTKRTSGPLFGAKHYPQRQQVEGKETRDMRRSQTGQSRRSNRVTEPGSFYHFQRMIEDVAAASLDADREARLSGFLTRYEADRHVILGLLLPHHAGLRWNLGADEAVQLAEALFGTRRSVAEHEASQSAPADVLVAFFQMNGRVQPKRRSVLSLQDAHAFLRRVVAAQGAADRVRAQPSPSPRFPRLTRRRSGACARRWWRNAP